LDRVAAAVFLFTRPSKNTCFVGIVQPVSDVNIKPQVAMRGEPETIDVEPEPESKPKISDEVSVFDGQESQYVTMKFENKAYTVNKKDWQYSTKLRNGSTVTGEWNQDWGMPQWLYKKREPDLRREWRKRKRKLRRLHGGGQRRPNGKLIFLEKMEDSPFTREIPKYAKKAEWVFGPKEVELRERKKRAMELKRRLEQEAEEKRIADRSQYGGHWLGRDAFWDQVLGDPK